LYVLMWKIHAPFWSGRLSSRCSARVSPSSPARRGVLVDGLNATRYQGTLESAFARGPDGAGSRHAARHGGGGVIAQATNLGVPYLVRAVMLALTFFVALIWMQDGRVHAETGRVDRPGNAERAASFARPWISQPAVRWDDAGRRLQRRRLDLWFYAMQPYLLQLHGRSGSYCDRWHRRCSRGGGADCRWLARPLDGKLFRRRTSALLFGTLASASMILMMG